MNWTKTGSSWESDNGEYRITTLPKYGASQDYYQIHHNIGGCWIPMRTVNGNRTIFRRTLDAAKAYCEAL
ncbi:hypothetical protein N9980_00780 [bacterium]|nr:hypothetical protein [bacterium]